MRLYSKLSLMILSLVFPGFVRAQIYSPAASDSFAAVYNPPGGTDEVFVYNRPEYRGELTVSVIAVSTGRQTGWDFQWAIYDSTLKSYTNLPGTSNGWFSGIDTITLSSGYQVTMTQGDSTHVYRVWIVFNDFQLGITNKDSENKLLFGYYNCSSLDLRAVTTPVPIYYFNPVTNARINIYNNYSVRWRTDNPEAGIPANRLITRVNSPPSEDTWYFLKLTDRFKLVRSDSVFYKSIQSDAKISGQYVNLSDSVEYAGHDYGLYYSDNDKSAPGKYKFDISGSQNSASYAIDFGDGEILELDSAASNIVHEFKKPGTYKVVLTTKSDKPYECADSANYEAELVYGKLAFPNVFTPNNDGDNDQLTLHGNDLFRSEDVSVVTIEIMIFDRAGRKVHSYSGNMRDWEGWDGRVMKSNRDAPAGVYYYVISAIFYYKDPIKDPINKRVFKGFFHLYRHQ
jgi:gliding motility-associated-like protein